MRDERYTRWFLLLKTDNKSDADEYLSSLKMKGDYYIWWYLKLLPSWQKTGSPGVVYHSPNSPAPTTLRCFITINLQLNPLDQLSSPWHGTCRPMYVRHCFWPMPWSSDITMCTSLSSGGIKRILLMGIPLIGVPLIYRNSSTIVKLGISSRWAILLV